MSVTAIDDLNNPVKLLSPPKRIVSLVPSLTELLYSLGLDDEVVGITKFCIHPEAWFRSKKRVGGTKTVKTAVIKALQPDLVIANREENVKAQVEELQQFATVYVTDINTLEDALQMITTIGELINRQVQARSLAGRIEEAFENLSILKQPVNTAYFIWREPYMAVGGNTFINDLLGRCGFNNIYKNISRYPEVAIENALEDNPAPTNGHAQLTTQNCQLLLLSSEPFPFKRKHISELRPRLPGTKIILADGEMFSWYGSRLLMAADYFEKLIRQIQG